MQSSLHDMRATVVGIEGREANIMKAEFARKALGLSNLRFVQSDVRKLSISNIGAFDVVLCWGLL
jgi:2-polyprenyl-3-methyl-5-hydroxy-6-metoxy-1,4-benzoquinol methylase